MRGLSRFAIGVIGSSWLLVSGTSTPIHAVEIPKPVITIPRPNIPRPVINVPRPNVTVNVPRPTINVPRPTVVVPKVDVVKPAIAVNVPKAEVPHHRVDVPKVEVPKSTTAVTVPKGDLPNRTVDVPKAETPKLTGVVHGPTANLPHPMLNGSSGDTPKSTGTPTGLAVNGPSGETPKSVGAPNQPIAELPRANSGGAVVEKEVRLPDEKFGRATVNSDGTVTVSNNLGTLKLTKQQMTQISAGDMSALGPLMGKGQSGTLGNIAALGPTVSPGAQSSNGKSGSIAAIKNPTRENSAATTNLSQSQNSKMTNASVAAIALPDNNNNATVGSQYSYSTAYGSYKPQCPNNTCTGTYRGNMSYSDFNALDYSKSGFGIVTSPNLPPGIYTVKLGGGINQIYVFVDAPKNAASINPPTPTVPSIPLPQVGNPSVPSGFAIGHGPCDYCAEISVGGLQTAPNPTSLLGNIGNTLSAIAGTVLPQANADDDVSLRPRRDPDPDPAEGQLSPEERQLLEYAKNHDTSKLDPEAQQALQALQAKQGGEPTSSTVPNSPAAADIGNADVNGKPDSLASADNSATAGSPPNDPDLARRATDETTYGAHRQVEPGLDNYGLQVPNCNPTPCVDPKTGILTPEGRLAQIRQYGGTEPTSVSLSNPTNGAPLVEPTPQPASPHDPALPTPQQVQDNLNKQQKMGMEPKGTDIWDGIHNRYDAVNAAGRLKN